MRSLSASRAASRLVLLILAASGARLATACSGDDDAGAPVADAGPTTDGTSPGSDGAPSSDAAPGSDGAPSGDGASDAGGRGLSAVGHIVVIYMENHSFDNLYGEFPGVEGLSGLDASAPNVQQIDESGAAYASLPPPPSKDGGAAPGFPPALPNAPFSIEDYVPEDAAPPDLHHLFYTEQHEIHAGAMNQFALWSDARGLTMGHYHTMNLPLPNLATGYTVCDHFFHAAFGGSFLNHQWLIAARTPVFPNAPAAMVQDPNALTFGQNEAAVTQDGYVVNTAFATARPHPSTIPAAQLVPPQTYDTIGDRLSAAGVDWAWFSGGWNDALSDAGPPASEDFQFHHQPFIYFAKYGDGTPGRAQHLKDEIDFIAAAENGTLPPVSFVKPVGIDNEHPGYTDVYRGDLHAVGLVNKILGGPDAKDTLIIVTYDEHGGFWDHVAPPAGDVWGPGSRVPALLIGPLVKKNFVDSTVYDTTSILATIEHRFGLAALADRDSKAKDLSAALQ